MKRFTIKKNSQIRVVALNGRKALGASNDYFQTIGECLQWAKRNFHKVTEVEITDLFNDTCASYSISGKKL